MVSSSIPDPSGFYWLCIVVLSGGCRVGFSPELVAWWARGSVRAACRGLPFGQWVSRTEYPTILMLDVKKNNLFFFAFAAQIPMLFLSRITPFPMDFAPCIPILTLMLLRIVLL
ncbi:hypothetical protein Hanom_Chr13g01200831 [Helianthus anomalus]